MNALQQEYNLIKEGKGNKAHFLKLARLAFPEHVDVHNTYEQTITILKGKSLLAETIETAIDKKDWFKIFEAEVKAMAKEVDKEVIATQDHNFDNKDFKNIDNLYGQAFLLGYMAEMCDSKNADKTVAELKDIVAKNMAKDKEYYFKTAMFSVKGIEGVQLDDPKEPKGKFKSSGYGDLKESKYSLLEMMDVTEEELEEAELEEGPMDQQIAAAEKKVEDLQKQVAAAKLVLANIEKKAADAESKV